MKVWFLAELYQKKIVPSLYIPCQPGPIVIGGGISYKNHYLFIHSISVLFKDTQSSYLGCLSRALSVNDHTVCDDKSPDSTACRHFCHESLLPLALFHTSQCCCLKSLGDLVRLGVSSECSNSVYEREIHVYLTQTAFDKCSQADFMNPSMPTFPPIGVATIPGSGNTWTRVLLEKLTGVRSGSVYNDGQLHQNLKGESESWHSKRVSFIKFHPENGKPFPDSGIILNFSHKAWKFAPQKV